MRPLSSLSSADITAIADYIASTRGTSTGGGGDDGNCDDDCGGRADHTSRRRLAVSTSNLRFGNEAVGTTSPARTVTFKNVSATTANLATVAASGDYAIAGGTCTQGATLGAGASCTVDVTFSPKAGGWRSGTLRVGLASSPVPTTVTLQGRGTSGTSSSATLSSTSVVFPAQPVMQASNAQALTLSNPAGGKPLSLHGLTVIGRAASDFALDSNCGSTLQPGAACVINVRFTSAGGAGTSSAMLWVTSDARGVVAARLRGTAVALNATNQAAVASAAQAVPATTPSALVASSPSLSFDPVASGSSSGDLEVDLTNTTSTAVAVGQVKANGGDFAVVADGCSGTTLATGASCVVQVRFSPQRTGQQVGSLSVAAAGSEGSVAQLSGVGLGTQAATGTGTTDVSTQSGGGGAFAPWALLLAAAAVLRRRRDAASDA
jgi:uncharacterized protein (TIGR03382 family)